MSGPARVAFALGKVWGAPCRHPTEELLAALCPTSCYLHRGAAGSENTEHVVSWPVWEDKLGPRHREHGKGIDKMNRETGPR